MQEIAIGLEKGLKQCEIAKSGEVLLMIMELKTLYTNIRIKLLEQNHIFASLATVGKKVQPKT